MRLKSRAKDDQRMYTARRLVKVDGEYLVLEASSPLVRFYFDRDVRGEEVRWWASPDRPDGLRRWAWGEEQVVGGVWPIVRPLRWPALPKMRFVRVDLVSEVVGTLIAVWATWEACKR